MFATLAGSLLILLVLWDAFETIMLAKRVSRKVRLAQIFYSMTWTPWLAVGKLIRNTNRRENYLSIYAPMSLILLLALWAAGLIFGFALVQWGIGTPIISPEGSGQFRDQVYMSGSTFFTLGIGDYRPGSGVGRALTVLEAGMGIGFLALVIGYLPGLSEAFSDREVNISLLDSRAGSPPTSGELLRRHASEERALARLLEEWERWSAELLESHISFPVLAYFRSQHDNQSWLSGLTALLDTCALVISSGEHHSERSARLTFAMARHAVVDMCRVLDRDPAPFNPERLSRDDFKRLHERLCEAGLCSTSDESVYQRLIDQRRLYEPYVTALAEHLLMPLPNWLPPQTQRDNWHAGN